MKFLLLWIVTFIVVYILLCKFQVLISDIINWRKDNIISKYINVTSDCLNHLMKIQLKSIGDYYKSGKDINKLPDLEFRGTLSFYNRSNIQASYNICFGPKHMYISTNTFYLIRLDDNLSSEKFAEYYDTMYANKNKRDLKELKKFYNLVSKYDNGDFIYKLEGFWRDKESGLPN